MTHRRPVAFLLFLLPFLGASAAQPIVSRPELSPRDISASLRSDWYGLYLQGTKIGYVKQARERTEEGIRDVLAMRLKLVSFNQKVEMDISQSLLFDTKAPHALIEGEYREDAGPQSTRFTFRRTGPGAYDVVQTVGNVQRKKSIKGLDFTLADALATEVWIRKGPAKGAEFTAREFEPKEQKIETQHSKVLSTKTSLVGGVPVKYYEIESISSSDQVKILGRHDDQGRMLSGKLAIFELRLEPEEQAKDTKFSKDLFVLGMAKVDRPLGDLKAVQELVLEVEGPGDVFEDGPRQSVADGPNGVKQIRAGKRYGKEFRASKEEIEENLRETSAHHIHDPKVKALAAQAIQGAVTDEEKVRKLTAFVRNYITPYFGNTSPTIHDLIERRRGDCKSYALMFTNLARAVGLPAREVSGLLYVGDDQRAFGGHAWNEVVLKGVWVPIDASLNETEVNATHLCFGTEKRATRTLLESLGKLSFRVVESKTSR